jgi:hypothetical protein
VDYPDDVSYRKAKAKFIMSQLVAGNIGVSVASSTILAKKEL